MNSPCAETLVDGAAVHGEVRIIPVELDVVADLRAQRDGAGGQRDATRHAVVEIVPRSGEIEKSAGLGLGSVGGLDHAATVAELFQFEQIHLVGFNGVEVLHRPSPRVLERRCRDNDVARNQFLGLDEGAVVNADALA